MRKVYALLPALVFVCSIAANAQSEKKEPPPPPPKPKNEMVEFAPLKIVKDEVKMKEPPPPPPKSKQEVKYKIVEEKVKNNTPTVIDEKVNPSKPSEPLVVTVKGKEADDFYKRNPTVSGISRQGSVITIKKKDGTSEKYDMNKKEEDKSFTEKYRTSPIPPPPPPPKKYLKYSH